MATLKISDLSVGDCVRYRDREWQVCSIYQFTGEVGLFRKDSQICESIEDIESIPITPEILEANGWERNEEDECMEWYGDPTSCIAHTKGIYRYRLEVPYVSAVCYFVHQLQHALRLAGVDKEIVMPNK